MTRSRRDFLRVGVLGLGWPALTAATPGPRRPAGKNCILLYMEGGPGHIDLWDPKPDAPAEIRGPFQPIATSVPGLRISEVLPRTARQMHHAALVRSVAHHEAVHPQAVYLTLTGREPDSALSSAKLGDTTHPHVGALLAHADRRPGAMPGFVRLPESMMMDGRVLPGQNAGFLGRTLDPLQIDVDEQGAVRPPPFELEADVTATRFGQRRSLLESFQDQLRAKEADPLVQFDGQQQQALAVLATPGVQQAFDLNREPAALRDRYGRHRHGQAVLTARRLVEAGARCVTVYWGRERQDWADGMPERVANNPWDGHRNHFPLTRDSLAPRADQALAALLEDLHQRGLLAETLVVWMGEFGRTPRITRPWASRDHWPAANSIVVAGAGITGGAVFGRTDQHAAEVTADRVAPADVTATIAYALGVNPRQRLATRGGQSLPLSSGAPIRALWC